jgi:hypothetical protein
MSGMSGGKGSLVAAAAGAAAVLSSSPPRAVPAVCRAVLVFNTTSKGWEGHRTGVITKVWGNGPDAAFNVSVFMDAGDDGQPTINRYTSLTIREALQPGERLPEASVWAEWPPITGQPRGGGVTADDLTKLVDQVTTLVNERVNSCVERNANLVNACTENVRSSRQWLEEQLNTLKSELEQLQLRQGTGATGDKPKK